jgi:hypothetical protein
MGSLFIVPLGIARLEIAHAVTLPESVLKRAKLRRAAFFRQNP